MAFTNETLNSANSTYAESTIMIADLMLSHGGTYACMISSDATITQRSWSTTVAVIGGMCVCICSSLILYVLMDCNAIYPVKRPHVN